MRAQTISHPDGRLRYAIALHGGAGVEPHKLTVQQRQSLEESLRKALELGADMLAGGGTSLDAVERVVCFLEDDPQFNAGRGAVFTRDGRHEMDAAIMDGRSRACGAVANVRTVKNPIALARLVMTRSGHILLAGEGAEQFAEEMKVQRVDLDYFDTDARRRAWEVLRANEKNRPVPVDVDHGTVGCVALDCQGNLAAGTSTGGLTNKRPGRVGDTPLIGAGTYADNAACAVSCTGIGEQFMRHVVAYDVAARMAYAKQSLEEAVREILQRTLRPNDGGLIAIARDGTIVMDFNTTGMSRAAADSTGYRVVKLGR